jgi:hypothetical protein
VALSGPGVNQGPSSLGGGRKSPLNILFRRARMVGLNAGGITAKQDKKPAMRRFG